MLFVGITSLLLLFVGITSLLLLFVGITSLLPGQTLPPSHFWLNYIFLFVCYSSIVLSTTFSFNFPFLFLLLFPFFFILLHPFIFLPPLLFLRFFSLNLPSFPPNFLISNSIPSPHFLCLLLYPLPSLSFPFLLLSCYFFYLPLPSSEPTSFPSYIL